MNPHCQLAASSVRSRVALRNVAVMEQQQYKEQYKSVQDSPGFMPLPMPSYETVYWFKPQHIRNVFVGLEYNYMRHWKRLFT